MDVMQILQELIKRPSITPDDQGCMDFITSLLLPYGFEPFRLDKEGTSNLFLKLKRGKKHLCFAGHTDVVPVLDATLWSHPPFEGLIQNDVVFGRGAVDMKGAIAAFMAAIPEIVETTDLSLSLLLTSDEEGPAVHGTKLMVEHLLNSGEQIDLCVVGEPTSEEEVCDTLKWGRRGSLSATVTFWGQSGHTAYPHKAQNPIPFMLSYLKHIQEFHLDHGMDGFDPSHLEITSIDVGNPASNVIPENIQARFNIRFNPRHSKESLKKWLQEELLKCSNNAELSFAPACEPFYGCSEGAAKKVQSIIQNILSSPSNLSTSGGTSDARFIKDLCPVIELGLRNETAHKVDEHVPVTDLYKLSSCYSALFCALTVGAEK